MIIVEIIKVHAGQILPFERVTGNKEFTIGVLKLQCLIGCMGLSALLIALLTLAKIFAIRFMYWFFILHLCFLFISKPSSYLIVLLVASTLLRLLYYSLFRKWQAKYPLIFEVSRPTGGPPRGSLGFGWMPLMIVCNADVTAHNPLHVCLAGSLYL